VCGGASRKGADSHQRILDEIESRKKKGIKISRKPAGFLTVPTSGRMVLKRRNGEELLVSVWGGGGLGFGGGGGGGGGGGVWVGFLWADSSVSSRGGEKSQMGRQMGGGERRWPSFIVNDRKREGGEKNYAHKEEESTRELKGKPEESRVSERNI